MAATRGVSAHAVVEIPSRDEAGLWCGCGQYFVGHAEGSWDVEAFERWSVVVVVVVVVVE